MKKTDEYEYEARSQSKDNKWCRIAYVLGRWCCSCKDFAHTCRACKHIAAVKKVFDASPPPRPRLNRFVAKTRNFAATDDRTAGDRSRDNFALKTIGI